MSNKNKYYIITICESWNYDIRHFHDYEKAFEEYNRLRNSKPRVTLSEVLKSSDPEFE